MQTQVQTETRVQTEECPWCGSTISRQRFLEVQERIRVEERERLAQLESDLRQQLELTHAKDLQLAKEAIEKRASEETSKKLGTLTADREAMAAKVKELEGREVTIRQQALQEAELIAQECLRQSEEQKQKEMGDLRSILEKDRDDSLLKKGSEFTREKEALQKKIQELDRQMKNMTANQIGDGAEVDLHEALKKAFPSDKIHRIKKGQPGADITHEVIHKGQSCGRIVYDSKSRQAWQNVFVTKLREDQMQAQAQHALLCTTVFPSGKKELCVLSDIIVINPARAGYIVEILRRALIAAYVQSLSLKQRQQKTDKLYQFIVSDAFTNRLRHVAQLNYEMLELDVQEKRTHDLTWKKRGTLLTRQGSALRDVDTEIAAIVEAPEQK